MSTSGSPDKPAMIKGEPVAERQLRTLHLQADLCVVGGGLAGVCCAITAARAGIKAVLMQDRPVLGGNASSEVRLWALGATKHMGSNNRWAREGGVINEIMVENLWRNREGNPLVFDALLLEKVINEDNITLLLNTAAFELDKREDHRDRIAAVRGFNAQNATIYEVRAPLFCDASGDGVVGFLAGAAFRMGAESGDEFDEKFAPSGEFGHLLGHSIYFYSKDVGRPVEFVPPSFALKDVEGCIPRHRGFTTGEQGCRLWWIEYGGRLDTVHDTETIKWELWRVVYGVWDYIKNSGRFPEAETMTLEWVGHVPGKRESRRFEGPYMLRQDDIVKRTPHDDDVAYGGWSIDLHPADGVYSELAGAHHLHSKGVYTIPYRCYFSRNIENLFLAGRIISASHVAFGTTRVMCTCAHGGQAVGMAAAICREDHVLPREVLEPTRMRLLQRRLLRSGHHIPGLALADPEDLAKEAAITASSELKLAALPADGPWLTLKENTAQMLPVQAGRAPKLTLLLRAAQATHLRAELRTTSDPRHQCPDVLLAEIGIDLEAGEHAVTLDVDVTIDRPGYLFCCLLQNEHVEVRCTEKRITGLLTVRNRGETDYTDVGGEKFATWRPARRPEGHNFALQCEPPQASFGPESVVNGVQRPVDQANAWVADFADGRPTLTLEWNEPRTISRVELFFDVDYDHAMETVQWGHPERAAPFCVKRYRVTDGDGNELAAGDENHQARNVIVLDAPVQTDTLHVALLETHGGEISPAALFEVRCYEDTGT